jgi:23S rRNA pseudouridine2605 synthase
MAERLQKVLAHAGVGSRRAVEALIVAGRVRVNGVDAILGQRVDPSKDVVEVDGSRVPLATDLLYYLMNKPEGVVTTASDPAGRPTVMDLWEGEARVWPVGRLDVASEGALVLTSDGDLTHRLTHPRFGVPKTYLVEVRGELSGSTLRRLGRGVDLEDGRTAPARVRLRGHAGGSSLVEVRLREGRNRQVRRMFETLGHPVGRLVRTAIGPLMLGRLRPGTYRRLTPEEVRAVYRACGL